MPDNPFSGFAEGMNQGVGWAVQKNQLDNQRQSLEMNRQYLDENKRQFNVKVGKDFFDMIGDIVDEPSGKVRSAKIDAAKDWVNQAGVLKVDEPFWSALNDDKDYIPKFKELLQGMGSAAPEIQAGYFENAIKNGHMSGKNLYSTLDTVIKGIATEQAAYNRQIMAGQNLNFRQTRTAQQQYDKSTDMFKFMLDGSLRGMGFLDVLKDPNVPDEKKLAATKQLRSLIGSEMTRVATAKNNFAEGTHEAMSLNTYENMLNDLSTKVLNKPIGELSPELIQQELNTYKELSSQYMGAHDRNASVLMSGATDIQKNVIGNRAKTFQNQYDKAFQKYGGWQGEGVQSEGGPVIKPSKEAPTKPNAPSPAEIAETKAALKLKQQFEKEYEQTPENKKEFIENMKKTFSPKTLKKLGIQ